MALTRLDFDQLALSQFLATHSQALLHDAPDRVKAAQERLCPRDTATNRHMADSILVYHHDGVADVGPARQFFYARMVETGGATNRSPKPFVRPSVNP